MKIEVDAMTALVDGGDMAEERGSIAGWGWSNFAGPDADGKLYKVYSCQDKQPGQELERWYEIFIEGELKHKLPPDTDIMRWTLERGWRSVVFYSANGGFAGPYPRN